MARIVNRSGAPVEVYGTPVGGVDEVFVLGPGEQTDDTFEVWEVRAAADTSAEIFESDGWWAVNTAYAFVYTFDDGVFWDDLSLHCVPFRMAAPLAGYAPAAANAPRDFLALTPTTPRVRATLEYTPGPFDGELDDIPEADFDFGIQVRTTLGNTTYISVRLAVEPHPNLTGAERATLTPVTGSRLVFWKDLIERTWAGAVRLSDGREIKCEVDWSGLCPHNTIRIHAARDSGTMAFPTTYTGWPLELDAGATGPGSRPVCAHEFGHHLGLNDGYVIEPEIPYLIDDPKITPLLGGKTLKATKYWTYLDRLFPDFWLFGLGKARATARLAGGTCGRPGDIMDDQYATENSGTQVMDAELVEAILDRRPQALCYAARQFDPKYVN